MFKSVMLWISRNFLWQAHPVKSSANDWQSYDEVDRRETDASWLASQQDGALVNERYIVPFLPVSYLLLLFYAHSNVCDEQCFTNNVKADAALFYQSRPLTICSVIFLSDSDSENVFLIFIKHI